MNIKKLTVLTVFGIAMGWWEGVVVVYIREILSLRAVDLTRITMEQVKRALTVAHPAYTLLFIEQTREVSTIVMLVAISLLLDKNWVRKIGIFLWTFAVWDIFYYVALKILLNWPPSLNTIDCLFLIPRPWIAPVWVPLTVMAGFLIISEYIFLRYRPES